MFEGMINGWRNADLNAAYLEIETGVVDRTNWILPAIWPRIKQYGNTVQKYAMTPVNLIFGCEAKEPPPMPEIPESFKNNAMGADLAKAYEQKCNKAIASAKSTYCLCNLDISGYREQQAINRHNEALHGVTLPEDKSSSTNTVFGSIAGATGAILSQAVLQQAGVSDPNNPIRLAIKGDVKGAAESVLKNIASPDYVPSVLKAELSGVGRPQA